MSKEKKQTKQRQQLLMERALAMKLANEPKDKRLELMLQAARHKQITDACYWHLLGICWRDRAANDPMEVWALLLASKRKERYRFMRREEIDVFASLPASMTVYRAGHALKDGQQQHEPALAWRMDGNLAQQEAAAVGGVRWVTGIKRPQVLATVIKDGAIEVVLTPNGGVTV